MSNQNKNSYEVKIKQFIQEIKYNEVPYKLYIQNSGKSIGTLVLLTTKNVHDDIIISSLMTWRDKNQRFFPSIFEVTFEGTKKWLKEQVIENQNRILFFVVNNQNKLVGHMGLYRFDYREKSCEIDNVIRGEKDSPGIMTCALNRLIDFAYDDLKIDRLYLRVFSDNYKAIGLYERCGFTKDKLIPMQKVAKNNLICWEELHNEKQKPERFFLQMIHHVPKDGISKDYGKKLINIAKQVRKDILQMSFNAQSAHTGGALSCVEILVSLYFNVMKVFPKEPYNEKRDRLFFSKAHDAKALYAVLAERGFFDKKILNGYEIDGGILPGHSTRHCVPGVEISAGSLGHGLSIAVGSAFAGKIDKKKYRVFAIVSDGECDEGSTWEAILFAGHHKLDNLTVIVDYNKLQGFGFTKDVLNLEPLAEKFKSFGWEVIDVDGHNFSQLTKILAKMPLKKHKPTIVIANTIKGWGGVKLHINQISSQYKPPTNEEFESLNKEWEVE